MSNQGWMQVLMSGQVAGSAVASTTVATSILPSHARYQLPPNFFSIGGLLKIHATGSMTTLTTGGTYTFVVNMSNANPPTVAVFTSSAIGTNVVGVSSATWDLELLMTCRAVSSAANFYSQGRLFGTGWLGSSVSGANSQCILLPTLVPAVGGNFDATAANFVDLTVQCSTNGAYSFVCNQYYLASFN